VVKYGKFLLYDHSFFSFAGSPIWEDGIGCWSASSPGNTISSSIDCDSGKA
jgi:hypothetical protein